MQIKLIFLLIILLVIKASAARAETNFAKDALAARLDQIMVEKTSHDRLLKLADLGANLSLAEIPSALATSKSFKQWRDWAVFQQAVVKHWADVAPAEAFNYLATFPNGGLKGMMTPYVTAKFTAQNPEGAATAVLKLPLGPYRNDAISAVAETWAKTDARKALTWVDDLPEGFRKDMALKAMLFTWVHIDPVASYPYIQKASSR